MKRAKSGEITPKIFACGGLKMYFFRLRRAKSK
jgi:hypothetical protein